MPEPIDSLRLDSGTPARKEGHNSPFGRLLTVALAQQKTLGAAITVITVLVIAGLTLAPGAGPPADHFDLCITCGTHWASDFGLNVLLFVPFGFGLRLAGVRLRTTCLVVVASTVSIELLQYSVVPGRDSDLSDILSNSLGGGMGIAAAGFRRQLLAPSASAAIRLSTAGALGCCALAACVQWALSISLPRSVYYEQVAPQLGQFTTFHGQVITASFNGAPFPGGRLPVQASVAMRDDLIVGNARLVGVITTASPPRRLAPVLSVFDDQHREIFVLGQRHRDLIFQIRRHTDDWGFRSPSLALSDAVPPQPGLDDTLRISATFDAGAGAPSIGAVSPAGRIERRIGTGVWQAWSLLLPDEGRYGRFATPVTLLVVATMFAPLGYWGGRVSLGANPVAPSARGEATTGRARRAASAAAPSILTLGAALAIIPWIAGSPAAPWPAWSAGAAALAFGGLVARRMSPFLDAEL
jgi:VanZ family protein